MSYKVGQVVQTRKCGLVAVVEVIDKHNIVVQFSDGREKNVSRRALDDGKIKNPYTPSIYGVGFIGEGDFVCSVSNKQTKEYVIWRGMLQRCYSELFLYNNPSYFDKTVCEDWHCLQQFGKWAVTKKQLYLKGWELDKDLLIEGNKVYSEYSCCFLPSKINSAISQFKENSPHFNSIKGKFTASAFNSSLAKLEYYESKDLEDVQNFLQNNKYNRVRFETELHKELLDPLVYNMLLGKYF